MVTIWSYNLQKTIFSTKGNLKETICVEVSVNTMWLRINSINFQHIWDGVFILRDFTYIYHSLHIVCKCARDFYHWRTSDIRNLYSDTLFVLKWNIRRQERETDLNTSILLVRYIRETESAFLNHSSLVYKNISAVFILFHTSVFKFLFRNIVSNSYSHIQKANQISVHVF